MAISFDRALGIHPLALKLRDQRTEVLAANLANADTPQFKARDLDFLSVLNGASNKSLELTTTHDHHQDDGQLGLGADLLYRVPSQPSLDGNTVETEEEHVRFAAHALQYQATMRFLNDDFAGLKTAIRGE